MRKKRKYKRIIQLFLIGFSLIALIIVTGLIYMDMRPMVVKAVTVEAGTQVVEVKDFLLDKSKKATFITDINSLDFNVPGVYEIQIQINNRIHSSNLEIVDTVAPKADPVSVIALKNEELDAFNFVTNVVDATEVRASFVTKPDTSISGEQEVTILLEDLGKNSITLNANLKVLDVKNSITVEAGSVLDVRASDFVENDNLNINILSDLSKLDISQPTVHTIEIEVDGRVLKSNIEVVDTTPPYATAIDKEVWKGDSISPIDFLENISDISAVRVSFGNEPDFESPGTREISVIVEDAYGNKTELKPMMTVKEDTDPPVFYGIQDKTVFEGDSVSYKKGVSVRDNRDKDVKFQVDSSKVNLSKAGTYKVYYTAEDSAGNKAEASATITVEKLLVTDEMLNEKVDKILAKITKEGMTKREIAWEIYQWVKGHVAYTGSSDKSDWRKEAYRGIVTGLGDCFTYYAVSEAFLTRAGIDNMRVTRVGGKTEHYWNLINCGDGWYHFDTCPNKDKLQTFMLTDKEVEAYTKKRGNNYYTFDKSLYPATPES